jgi:fructose-bisphosphate aldolase class II
MPLVLDFDSTWRLYRFCAENDLVLARIGYSDQDQLQGIVRGAARFARELGIEILPVGVFSTVGHYIFQQLPRYLLADHTLPSAGGDPAEYRRRLLRNARLATGFLSILTERGDPEFGCVHVTHHYDHGHHTLPGGDRSQNELLHDLEFLDLFSSVMFDDTHSPFEDNVRHSIAYREELRRRGRRKVLEGCLEEVAAGGAGKAATAVTDPECVEEYLERTGFDLVVPNIGTESIHARQVGVDWSVLERLHERGVGHRLVVHGYSSIRRLAPEEQRRLGRLGVVGMNAWSYIPQAIGPQLLERSANILRHRDAQRGYPVDFDAGGAPLYNPSDDANVFFGPLLDQVRDLKVRLIADSVFEILKNLGYERLRSKILPCT